MESAYFTPEIGDFYVGYEFQCKVHGEEDDWVNCIYSKPTDEMFCKDSDDNIWVNDSLRVPYLTKEQIEAEGWKHDERYDDVKHFYTNELHLTLYIAYLKEEIIYHHISIFHGGGIMFRGECKDINTFRKICKLLGI